MKKKPFMTAELTEAIRDVAQAKTTDELRTYTRHVYVMPATPKEVKSARTHLKQSQSQFADWLGVSTVTVQAWESGRRKPEAVVSKVIRYATLHPKWVKDFARFELLGAV